MTSTHHARLIENHLEFLATHRGEVTHVHGAALVVSKAPGFTCAVLREALPERELDAILGAFDTARIVPGGEANEPLLLARGYAPGAVLVYMELPEHERAPAVLHDSLRIEWVGDELGMADFTKAQVEGFVEDPEQQPVWYRILGDANLRNVGNAGQIFYIGYVGDEPAGVTLLVVTPGVAGIYAVATRPGFRRLGVSTTLLRHAVAEARSRSLAVALQVMEGSHAERLYEKLGFRRAFVSRSFTRQAQRV